MSRSERRRAQEAVGFRLDSGTAARVAAKANRHGLSIGQYARALVIEDSGGVLPVLRRGPPRDAAELRTLAAHVGKIGSNLNQIARTANTPGVGINPDDLGRAFADLAVVRDALVKALRVRDP